MRNNFLENAFPFVYYNGYVSFYPQLIAWMLTPFPLFIQIIAYSLVAGGLVFLLLCALSRYAQSASESSRGALFLPAMAVVVILLGNGLMFSNLTFSIWVSFSIIGLRLLSLLIWEYPLSWGEALFLSFLASGFPLSIVLAPLVALAWWRRRAVSKQGPLVSLFGSLLFWFFALSQFTPAFLHFYNFSQNDFGRSYRLGTVSFIEEFAKLFYFFGKAKHDESFYCFIVLWVAFLASFICLHWLPFPSWRKKNILFACGSVALLIVIGFMVRGYMFFYGGRYVLLPSFLTLLIIFEVSLCCRVSFALVGGIAFGLVALGIGGEVFVTGKNLEEKIRYGIASFQDILNWDHATNTLFSCHDERTGSSSFSSILLTTEKLPLSACVSLADVAARRSAEGKRSPWFSRFYCGPNKWIILSSPLCLTPQCDRSLSFETRSPTLSTLQAEP